MDFGMQQLLETLLALDRNAMVWMSSKTDKIELFRQARLKRGSDEVQGDYISYDMKTEFFKVIGSKERGDETGPDKRVRITIQPKNNSE